MKNRLVNYIFVICNSGDWGVILRGGGRNRTWCVPVAVGMSSLSFSERNQNGLFLILGLPTWAIIDGVFASLNRIADDLPEGYQISAFLVICLSLGNCIPMMLGGLLRDVLSARLTLVIRVIIFIAFVAAILLSFTWNVTVEVGDDKLQHNVSLSLLILYSVLGACASSSNVTHFTLVSKYGSSATSYLAMGMGLGSMISGLLSLITSNVYEGFTVRYYFFLLSLLFLPAFVALFFLARDGPPPERTELLREDEFDSKVVLLKNDGGLVAVNDINDGSNDNAENYDEKTFLSDATKILLLSAVNATMGWVYKYI